MNGNALGPRAGLVVVLALVVLAGTADAAYLRNVKQEIRQPDGSVVQCLASGDEYFNFLHDEDGYVLMQDASGWLTYAERVGDELKPGSHRVGRADPVRLGIQPWLRPGNSILSKRWERFNAPTMARAAQPQAAPPFTNVVNPVLYIFFQDEDISIFSHGVSSYDEMYNSTSSGVNSVRNYFREASYNQLTVSSVFPTSNNQLMVYQDDNPRSYYRPTNGGANPDGYPDGDSDAAQLERAKREHELLARAVQVYTSNNLLPNANYDNNNDGYVDNVTFIISGSPDGWSDLIWPHRWFMSSGYPVAVTIGGKQVDAYNFNLDAEIFGDSGVGVLCHEFAHTLGAPDLYHYREETNTLAPVGKWDLMEQTTNPGQHLGAYMKLRYLNWITSIPEITTSGVYSLNPITSATNNAYKIRSPNSTSEYFVVEYRRKTGLFEGGIPGSGLLVYRINTEVNDGTGNRNGPPDEVYIYRPGGSLNANGDVDNAHFSAETGRTSINDSTNPASTLQNGTTAGGLNISQVGSAGATISFRVTLGGGGSCTYQIAPASWQVQAAGGGGSVAVVTSAGCPWTATSNASWISITAGSSGSGNGSVSYSVAANSSGSGRTGTLTIAGRTHTVTQSGTGGGGGSYTYWVETAAKAGGSGGSQWFTDLGILNIGSGTSNLTIRLHSGSKPYGTASLGAGQQGIFRDIVGQLETTGSGALEITSTQPLVVTSRTFNQAPGGTFGQYYNGFSSAELLAAGSVAYLGQLQQNSSYRTNIAVANTGATPASVRVTLYAGNGASLGSYTVNLGSGERKQENQPLLNKGGQSNLAAAWAKVEVLSGNGVIASASVIDQATSDPTTIPFKR